MNDTKCLLELSTLSVYRQVGDSAVIGLLRRALAAAEQADASALCQAVGELASFLYERPQGDDLAAAVAAEVLQDDNVLTRAFTAGVEPSERIKAAAMHDLGVLYRATQIDPAEWERLAGISLPSIGLQPAEAPLAAPWNTCLDALRAYHRRHGFGVFSQSHAFLWYDEDIHPVVHPDPIRLDHLKGYEEQKKIIVRNTEAFVHGREANNVLLYGDRGTGKSSTVKALLNEYAPEGLRMIEMPKACLRQLPKLTDRLAAMPIRFIVFVDDLSFGDGDDSYASMKAVLEGGLSMRPSNVLIYATSNRRHLLRESFSDRNGDDLHHADTVQESVSLSDRFGISLTYFLPDKAHFMKMVEQMAEDRGLNADREELLKKAESWATEHGGWSPRFASQFLTDWQKDQ